MSVASPTRALLLGGTSEIGIAILRRMASERTVEPYLLGRDRVRLNEALSELHRAGCVDGVVDELDASALESHPAVIEAAFERSGGFDVVVLAVGLLGAQEALDADRDVAAAVMDVNFLGCGSLLLESLRRLRAQRSGTLIVLSSAAAERPRASNAIYGAAKTGLDALAQALADATVDDHVRVLVVRPGFVRTRMTAGLDPAPMATTSDAVAQATLRALSTSAHTVWVPARLRIVFAVLRHLPRWVWRRLPV